MTEQQRAQFFAMRKALDGYVDKIVDNPVEINANLVAIRPWAPGPFEVNDVRMYEGNPYRCKQGHDSTYNPGWTPAEEKALWGPYHGTTPETAREFEADSANMYKVDEYAIEAGKIYRNNYDGNVYPPSVLPERWEYIRDVE